MTKLFTTKQIHKLFHILDKLSGSYPVDLSHYPWKDYQTIYTEDSNHIPSTKEVFVHRTINKWLIGKELILYKVSDLGITYKQYVSIIQLAYYNDWNGGYIRVRVFDYTQLCFITLEIRHNDALSLEGEWCTNLDKHIQVMNLILMKDVPDKEYIFKAYDWSKYPKRVRKGVNAISLIETTKSFIAKTEKQAYKLKREFEENSLSIRTNISIGELIEVKVIKI